MKSASTVLASFGLCLYLNAVAQTPGTAGEIATPKAATETIPSDAALRDEIVAMSVDDQKVRQSAGPIMSKEERKEMQRVDQIHEKRMKEIVAQYGWPGKSLVGADGSHRAWLVVQHCSPSFQEECLPLLARAVEAGEATKKNHAYLLDRVRMHQGKPQIYGTQFRNGTLWQLEDPEHVDERRRSVGLGTLEEYFEKMGRVYKKPNATSPPAVLGNRGTP